MAGAIAFPQGAIPKSGWGRRRIASGYTANPSGRSPPTISTARPEFRHEPGRRTRSSRSIQKPRQHGRCDRQGRRGEWCNHACASRSSSAGRAFAAKPLPQVHGAGEESLVELASGGDQPVSRARSDPLAAARPQPDCVARRIHPRTARGPRGGVGALQPDQPGISSAQGIPGRRIDLEQRSCRRAGIKASGLFLRRIWHS